MGVIAAVGKYEQPISPESINPIALSDKIEEAKALIDKGTAQIVIELFEQKLIPSWAIKHLDIEFIRMAV